MRLTALVQCPEHVCCRYRLAAYAPALQRHGHRLDLQPLPRRDWQWLTLAGALRAADVVILQRRLLRPWQRLLLRRAARRLVYDFDDAVFFRDSYAPNGLYSSRRLSRFGAIVGAADRVVAGNSYLAREVERWTGPGRARVIPTCVDPTLYRPTGHGHRAGIRLVWVGSSSTLRGLERARGLIEAVGAIVPGLTLVLVCDRFAPFRGLAVEACSWSDESEKAALAGADIGISWVPDDLWSRGKCGLKILQYMAAGLPVVANPVGVQAELVKHGVTGFLARTPADWADAVRRLAADPGLRRCMGAAGRKMVEESYSVHHGAAQWLGLLDELCRRKESA